MADTAPGQSVSIFVATGELSGDMHAAHAIRALDALRAERGLPPAVVDANGSEHLAAAGAALLHDVATWSEIGWIPSLLKAPMFLAAMRATVRFILERGHEMVILVDSRVMNLRIAKALREQGYKGRIVYYVAPVRWESLYDPEEHELSLANPRFRQVKQYCDLAIPIYPVSLEVYRELEMHYLFPGHPLCELARPSLTDAQFSALTGIPFEGQPPPLIIGALTGSRVGEIRAIAPHVFRALRLIQEALATEPQLPRLHFVASVAHPKLRDELLRAARQAGLADLALVDSDHTYDLMARARLMVVKSGTCLHECMLLGVPAVMCYRVSAGLAWIARHIMRFGMPMYGFPNLLAGRIVVPELIQEECRQTRIAEVAGELLFDREKRETMLAEFTKLRAKVCRPQPLRTIAEALQAQFDHARPAR